MKGGMERCGQAPWENELLGLPVLSLCVLPDCFSDPNLLQRTERSPHPPVTDRMGDRRDKWGEEPDPQLTLQR